MNVRRKFAYAAALLATMLLFQSCATVVRGTSQKIPVTSTPTGARVIVDGKDMGASPLTLKLKRKKPHVIRIEQEGYNPHEIRIRREKPALSSIMLSWWGNTAVTMPLVKPIALALTENLEADDLFEAFGQAILILGGVQLALAGVLTIGDFATGAPYSLSPESLAIALTPVSGNPRPEITQIDEAALRNVKWLRIRAGAARPPH
jgi:hypothetical protein